MQKRRLVCGLLVLAGCGCVPDKPAGLAERTITVIRAAKSVRSGDDVLCHLVRACPELKPERLP